MPATASRAAKAARGAGPPASRGGATADAGADPAADGLVALHRVRFVPWSPSPVVAAAARRDGAVLAAARDDGEIELWETGTWASLVVSLGWMG